MSEQLTDDGYRSTAEFSAALDRLSTADMQRLLALARVRAVATGLDAEDLLQEAVRRALQGDRRWPRGVELLPFLANAMRSIAHAERKERSGEREGRRELGDVVKAAVAENASEKTEDADDNKKRVADVFGLFEDGEPAQWVLLGLLEGCTAQEICSVNNIDETTYATIRRRIRRKVDQTYPEGWKK